MKRKRFTEEQIAFALRQAEAGPPVEELRRKMGCPRPRSTGGAERGALSRFAGMGVPENRRLRQPSRYEERGPRQLNLLPASPRPAAPPTMGARRGRPPGGQVRLLAHGRGAADGDDIGIGHAGDLAERRPRGRMVRGRFAMALVPSHRSRFARLEPMTRHMPRPRASGGGHGETSPACALPTEPGDGSRPGPATTEDLVVWRRQKIPSGLG
jgi:hypothetical protein